MRSLSYSWYLHLHQLLFRYIEGGGNSPNQTFSPLILFYWIALLFSYLLIPPILLTDYFISWMREQSLVLFSPSGRRKMENMKLFEHPEVLEFDQRGEEWTWILLAYHPSYHFMCMFCFNFRWLSVTESFIPFHILSHPSSPLHSNRPRWSKCLTFVARMYYFKAPVLLSTGVLVYWLSVFQCRCASFYPVNLQFVCSWPQVLYICPNDTFAFWLCLPSSILT